MKATQRGENRMQVVFEKWHCSNITPDQKNAFEENIRNELTDSADGMKYIPKNLTVSIFEIPHTRSLSCTGVDDSGNELVTYIYPISGGASKFHFPKD